MGEGGGGGLSFLVKNGRAPPSSAVPEILPHAVDLHDEEFYMR